MSGLEYFRSTNLSYRLAFIGLLFSITAGSQPNAIPATDSDDPHTNTKCIVLADPDGWSVGVRRPGHYCMDQDLHQSWPIVRLPHQRMPLSSLISIYGPGATIDINGHRLSSSTPINSGIFTNISGDDNIQPTVVKNGTILTARTPAAAMIDAWNAENYRFGSSYTLAASHGDLSKYKPTIFTLENLSELKTTLVQYTHIGAAKHPMKENVKRRKKVTASRQRDKTHKK